MTKKGAAGVKNRNFPSVPLDQAASIPRAIQEKAGGLAVKRITLAELVGRSPGSSAFGELLASSRMYGFTTGGQNADHFELTQLGQQVAAEDGDDSAALRQAVLTVPPFKSFLEAHDGKRVPVPTAIKAFLTSKASVPESRAEECQQRLLADARHVGFIRAVKGSEWIDLQSSQVSPTAVPENAANDIGNGSEDQQVDSHEGLNEQSGLPNHSANGSGLLSDAADVDNRGDSKPKKVFIAHGKNRRPLDQLKAILDKFGVKYVIAVDEPHAGRPISAKVANLMRLECSSAIFIFTADELFYREDEAGNRLDVWRPSENVIFELGAACILYDRRIVIFKEKTVTFPSDYSDLGHITFEADALNMQLGDLFSELVALGILEVRAKS